MKKYISVLNVIACLSVVLLHANGTFWSFEYSRTWISADIIESVFYFAVPVFFMITGCTLIDYPDRYDTKTYLKKRFSKTLIPFLFWSGIGLVYQTLLGRIVFGDLTIKLLIDYLINANIVSIYWFFIPLFAIYLCIPFFAKIEKQHRQETFRYMIFLCFIFNIALPLVFSLLGINYNGSMTLSVGSGYLFWIMIGYYIDHYEISKRNRIIIYFAGVMGLLMHICGTWFLSYRDGAINRTFKGYNNLPSVLYAIAIFLAFKQLDKKNKMDTIFRLTQWIHPSTFGIYLIHWYIIDILVSGLHINNQTLTFRLGGGVLIFLSSAVIVWVLKKIPGIRRMLP